ncbi:unnamed protein product [Scytosiphon promiscuus]
MHFLPPVMRRQVKSCVVQIGDPPIALMVGAEPKGQERGNQDEKTQYAENQSGWLYKSYFGWNCLDFVYTCERVTVGCGKDTRMTENVARDKSASPFETDRHGVKSLRGENRLNLPSYCVPISPVCP